MKVSDGQRLKALEAENSKLKQLRKQWYRRPPSRSVTFECMDK